MPIDQRLYLLVPFAEKDKVKQLGARWDPVQRQWYLPVGLDHQHFTRWLPAQSSLLDPLPSVSPSVIDQVASHQPVAPSPQPTADKTAPRGVSLTQLLNNIAGVVQSVFPQGVWVTAEITELQHRQGHWYLTLAESQAGQQLAQVKANLWAGRVGSVQDKFIQATGDWIKAGQKVLLLCEPAVHPRFGLSLVVLDIDPRYTLGEQARKLLMIRADLKAQGLYARNRQCSLPSVWSRVAVLSPAQAAGLGDFQRDADRLSQLNLCEFVYFHASFQGVQVLTDMAFALERIRQAHQQSAFDALVIIRGGGAQQDLMFLNELELAQAVAQLPLPVLTGIGHERDNTILDEIAHTRCDTPSKVIALIQEQIVQQARNGLGHWQWIKQRTLLLLAKAREQHSASILHIRHQAQHALRHNQQDLQHYLHHCDRQVNDHLSRQREKITQLKQQTLWSVQQRLTWQKQTLLHYLPTLAQQAQWQVAQHRHQLHHHHQVVSLSNPKRLLHSGYVLVQAGNGRYMGSQAQAQTQANLQLHFHDGVLAVVTTGSNDQRS